MLTQAQKLSASSRVADGDEVLLNRVPITSASGRYDDGIPDIDPAELEREQAEAQQERFRQIARDEKILERRKSSGAESLLTNHHDVRQRDVTKPADFDLRTVIGKPNSGDSTFTPKRVRRLSDGEIFDNATHAGASLGSAPNAIRTAIAEGRPFKGERSEYVNDSEQAAPVTLPTIPEPEPFARTPENAAAIDSLEALRQEALGEEAESPPAAADDEYGPDDEDLRPVNVTVETPPVPAFVIDPPVTIETRTNYGRRVRRVRDGHIFDGAKDAGDSIGVTDAAIRQSIKRGGVCVGEKFEWVEGEPVQRRPSTTTGRPNAMRPARSVRCVETREEWPSQRAACAALNYHETAFAKAMKAGRKFKGFRYVPADQPDPEVRDNPSTAPLRVNARRVVNVKTGYVYESIADAHRKMKMTEKAMRLAISKRVEFHFEGETPMPSPSQTAPVVALPKTPIVPPPAAVLATAVRPSALATDKNFLARTMFAFAKSGGSIDHVDAVVAEAERIAEARRLLAIIDGQQGGRIELKDGRLVVAGEGV